MKKQEISQFQGNNQKFWPFILQIAAAKTLGPAKEPINQTKHYQEKQQNLLPVFILPNSSYLPLLFKFVGLKIE